MKLPPRTGRRAVFATLAIAVMLLLSGCDADLDLSVQPDSRIRITGTTWTPVEYIDDGADGCSRARSIQQLLPVADGQAAKLTERWNLEPDDSVSGSGKAACHLDIMMTPRQQLDVKQLGDRVVLTWQPGGFPRPFEGSDKIQIRVHLPGDIVETTDGLSVQGSTATVEDPFVTFQPARIVAHAAEPAIPFAAQIGLVAAASVLVGTALGWRVGVHK